MIDDFLPNGVVKWRPGHDHDSGIVQAARHIIEGFRAAESFLAQVEGGRHDGELTP